MSYSTYCAAEIVMLVLGLMCFFALYFIPAGYGKLIDKKWGFSFNNKTAWTLMECPTLIVMFYLLCTLDYEHKPVRVLLASFFILHYIQRTLIFPALLKGKSKMPITIVLMGMLFNSINSFLIGLWIFYFSPAEMYDRGWLSDPRFIAGAVLFFVGMIINISSDSYIRSLRKNGSSKHYYPSRGMYRYITSANYFGELVEWLGFAVLTWSSAGFLFVFWTACNLVPRSDAIYKKYAETFPDEVARYKPKRIIPFLY
ncbi:hypothetical protein HMPREF9194_00612 [Treponema maltophilum ATCC 51939]|uniref:3-oxo-5-alpha-steroid 4-dehydrogenase 1 n=1 Tax=Treponema maltophilum ATCC 51939 TaxID=1125699 RepID=S3KDM2_TREMA|nr:DUF1295 domain-containing protein [Treponema maltophilum]EPF30297.1 hypothetical protein HMPREF9194_00612 [Treponema maltophilum ATCC 51939]